MLSQSVKQTEYIRALLDGVLLCGAFVLAFEIRSHVPLPFLDPPAPLSFEVHFWLLLIAVPLYWALSHRNGPNEAHATNRDWGVLRSVGVPFIYLGLLLSTTIFLFQAKSFSRAVFFLFLLFGFTLVATKEALLRLDRHRMRRRAADRDLLIVGVGPEADAIRATIESHPEYQMRVVGHLAGPHDDDPKNKGAGLVGAFDDLKRIVEEHVVDEVIFVLPPAELLSCEQQIAWCEEVGVTVHLKMDFVQTLFARTYTTELDGTPMLTVASTPRDPVGLLIKRGLDIGISVLTLALLSPVIAVVAILVPLTSRGPVFFSQERVGLNGRPFRLYKFRSMYRDAERRKQELESLNEMSGPVFKIKSDPRVTPLGRWLRKFSVDELPQLWNVLRGDMSLVGPRPPLADEVRRYQRWQRRRLSMKPGITCLWQVNGRNQIAFADWMKLDLEYIDNWSLSLDLKILLRTLPAVVFARGAR